MSLKWTSQNIKLESVESGKVCSARLRLTKKTDTWSLQFNAFWLKPQSAELWMIGNNAKMLLKFDNVSGNYSIDKEFKAIEWDAFFYNAQCCALYSSGKVIMKGTLSGASPMSDMAMQTMLMSARRQNSLPIKNDKPKVNKPLEFEKPTLKQQNKPVPKVASVPTQTIEKSKPTIKKEEPSTNTPSINRLSFEVPKVISDKGFLKKHDVEDSLSPVGNLYNNKEFDIPINHVIKPETVLKEIKIDNDKEVISAPTLDSTPIKDIKPAKKTLPDIIEVDLRKNKDSKTKSIEITDKIEQKPLNTSSPISPTAEIESITDIAPDTPEIHNADNYLEQKEKIKTETSKKDLPKLDDIKKLLARKPIDRTVPQVKEVKINPAEFKPVKCDFMLWNVERIENEVDNNPTESPFVGTFKGSRFARVEIATKDSFDHLLVGKVPLDNIPVYMLCIPGSATNPPIGVEGFGRWIPTKDGKGYWVKYITN